MVISKVLFLAFKLLIEFDIIGVYLYQQLLQSIYSTIFWLDKDNNS